MKYPKGFFKLSIADQKKWVAEQIEKVQAELDELKKVSRKLIQTGRVIVDERPDELHLKA